MSAGPAISPSPARNPAASASSPPGVRIVTASGSPSTRISSGSSTASSSRSPRRSEPRTRSIAARATWRSKAPSMVSGPGGVLRLTLLAVAAPALPPALSLSVPVLLPVLAVLLRGVLLGEAVRQTRRIGLRRQPVQRLDLRAGEPDARDAGLLPAPGGHEAAVRVRPRDDLVHAVRHPMRDVDVLRRQVPRVDVAPPWRA